ncbi:ABC transporter ATP-binding protein [Pseudorhodoplanes sp.]|uniref:ABC transporter ATP-binding protein n=1 Tax=Pseudorhodoplanes sp. TaxID=1934341 RepID=UPI003D101E2A
MKDGPAVETKGLSKVFTATTAVDDITFAVRRGEVFGFMGHNGAGKTTTLRMLMGLLRPTSGRATVLGHDIVEESLSVRRVTGFLPGDYALPREMTARQFLRYIGAMFGFSGKGLEKRIDELLMQFELSDAADRRLGTFSSGMTQKVGLAQALLNSPRVLLLDEPTSGLDPMGRRDTLELITSLAQENGVTILFSTHILNDIERVCARVAVLHYGRLIAYGDLAELRRTHGTDQMDDLYLSLVKGAG